jgi:aspartyl-tRNA(Asn)/glutamyl-tRNA(Gln) amidotransferase subunit C
MKINKEDIIKLADLAKLQLSDVQIEEMESDMEKMLGFVEKLKELDVEGLEPLRYMTSNENVLRDDVMEHTITKEDALRNAPQKDSDYIKVPKVLKK